VKDKLMPVILFLALILNGYPANGQTMSGATPKRARTEADYQRRTLKEIDEISTEFASDRQVADRAIVTSNILPSQVRMTYMGLIRPVPDRKQQVLRQWAAQYAGAMETYTKPYQSEMLFVENGIEYWLAVKSKDIPKFQQSLQAGRKVKLNVIRMGGIETSNGWEWMLLVEGFRRI